MNTTQRPARTKAPRSGKHPVRVWLPGQYSDAHRRE